MIECSKEGRTVEEAVEAALSELGVERDMVDVEVLEGGSRGLFGLIGGQPAQVRVRVTAGKDRFATEFLTRVTALMDMEASVEAEGDDEAVNVRVRGGDAPALIGHRGQTLDALQLVAEVAVARRTEDRRRLHVDVGGYRERRRRTVEEIARRAARQARRTGRPVELEPMPARERRFVHIAVREMDGMETESLGAEPRRRVVIRLADEERAMDVEPAPGGGEDGRG